MRPTPRVVRTLPFGSLDTNSLPSGAAETNTGEFIIGGAANLKLGHHLVVLKDTPLCNAWLTMLLGPGVNSERHGDSTGMVKELLA